MESIFALWQRDVILFFRDKARLIGSIAMPFFFLIILGNGINGSMKAMMGGNTGIFAKFNYSQYMFPGMVGITILITSIYSALSVVQDREYGYLKEILVSPSSRISVAVGKVLGGTTVAALQGIVIFVFIPLVGVKVNLEMVLKLIPAMFLVAFTLSSVGVFIASLVKTSGGFQAVEQLMLFPMLFLSGSLYPLNGIPLWMSILVKINPITYAIDIFKKIILNVDKLSPDVRALMGLDLNVLGHSVTLMEEIAFIAAVGIIFIILASYKFSKSN